MRQFEFKNIMRSEWVLPPETIPDRKNDVLLGKAMNSPQPGDIIQVDVGEGCFGWSYGGRIIAGIVRYDAAHAIQKDDWVWLSDIKIMETVS